MRGFTLIEALTTMTILGLMLGITVVGTRALERQEHVRTRETIRTELTAARDFTIAGANDSGWGISFSQSAITLFQGTSYATRNQAFDRVTDFEESIVISGPSEIVFLRPRGTTASVATITVTDESGTNTVSVNTVGAIEVQ